MGLHSTSVLFPGLTASPPTHFLTDLGRFGAEARNIKGRTRALRGCFLPAADRTAVSHGQGDSFPWTAGEDGSPA